MLKEEVVKLVGRKLPQAEDADIVVDEVEQVILNHCNLLEVPPELKYIWMRMSLDVLRYELALDQEPDSSQMDTGGKINSIKAGDTTFGIADNAKTQMWKEDRLSHQAKLDETVMAYQQQLNAYRVPRGYGYGRT